MLLATIFKAGKPINTLIAGAVLWCVLDVRNVETFSRRVFRVQYFRRMLALIIT